MARSSRGIRDGGVMTTRRTEQYNLRLTPEEKARIEAAAAVERRTVASFIRNAALRRAELCHEYEEPAKPAT